MNSCVVIDDFWKEACDSEVLRNCFKIISGKLSVTFFITTQNAGGTNARTIRNNCSHFILFSNLGDVNINKRLTKQMGLLNRYNYAKTNLQNRHSFVFINVDLRNENEKLMVMINIFDTPHCYA